MDPSDILFLSGAFVLGGILAWWWRSSREMPDRLRLVEQFERRARLAEREQEQAIRTLNENQIEVRRIQGLFEGLETQIRELEADLQKAGNDASVGKKDLHHREEELKVLRGRVETLQSASEKQESRTSSALAMERESTGRAAELEETLDTAQGEIQVLQADAERTAERLHDLSVRAEEVDRIEANLEEVRLVLAEREGTLAERDAELRKTIERLRALEDVDDELEARQRDLAQRNAEVAELRTRVEALQPVEAELEARRRDLAVVEQEASGLNQRVAVLAPLEAELQETREAVLAREHEIEMQVVRAEAAERALEGKRARVEELTPLEGELLEKKKELELTERNWQARHEDAHKQVQALELKLGETTEKADDLARRLATMKTHEHRSEEELTALEGRLAKREQELEGTREFKGQAKALTTELDKLRKSEHLLASKLEKEQERGEADRERLRAAREADAKRRKELEEWKVRLSKLSASHKAIQLKADRYAKRVEELSRDLTDRKGTMVELKAELREKNALTKSLQAAAKKSASRSASRAAPAKAKRAPKDELQELAGVGPALEKKLNRSGVRHFEDVALLDKEGVEALAEKVGIAAPFIRRNKWVNTARRLHRQKYGSVAGS